MTLPSSPHLSDPSSKGVIVGCDAQQEWLLPWWWQRYSEANSIPVAFFDFGMTSAAQEFCHKHGKLIHLNQSMSFLADKARAQGAENWEEIYKQEVWQYRPGWFKKPFALYLSPFESSLWLDLDCEVLASIDPLFDYLQTGHFAAVPENGHKANSGVIAFKRSSPLIRSWVELSIAENARFMGDQDVLSELLSRFSMTALPYAFNWRVYAGDPAVMAVPPETVIVHWACPWGKRMIKEFGGLGEEMRSYLMKLRRVP